MRYRVDMFQYGIKEELTRMPWWKRSTSWEITNEDAGNNTEDPVISPAISEYKHG